MKRYKKDNRPEGLNNSVNAPSRADTRRKGYRRGKQTKFLPYTFSLDSESKQLDKYARFIFTAHELGEVSSELYIITLVAMLRGTDKNRIGKEKTIEKNSDICENFDEFSLI